MSDAGAPARFIGLSTDLTELIFSYLPVPSLIRASAVCKLWNSIVLDPSFSSSPAILRRSQPWFFLCGLHNTSSKNHQSFAFDPASGSWFRLPLPPSLSSLDPSSSFAAASGFLFTTAPNFTFTCFFTRRRGSADPPPLRFSRINPLLGVSAEPSRFIVAGGVRFIGGLVDIEDRLAVEIYNPRSRSWNLGPPLPDDFRSGNSSQSLSSALFGGRFYVFGIYSCFVSAFDLQKRVWSDVQTLRPPGVIFSFLIACEDGMVLAGLCNSQGGPSFTMWRIHEETMEFCEIAVMPQDLLYGLVDEEEDDKFASLKCVGLGKLVYVFNEEYHKKYPACVCEIASESPYKCNWRRLPRLPSPVNKFHKVISFCSTVSLGNVLRGDGEEAFHSQGNISTDELGMNEDDD